jgi:TolB protein
MLLKEASQPAFSRDGDHFAFHSWQPDTNGLRIVDAGGRNGNRITKFAEDNYPTWSPDGTQLAFSSTRESDRRVRIFTSWSGGLADGLALTLGASPSWSVKGPIAYHGCDRTGGNCGIWSITPDGGSQNQLTSHESDNAPSWSADGSGLAFMSARDGNWEIYRAGADGSNPVRLTENGANDGLPVWSPDGTTLAFVSDRGGGWALYLMPAGGGEPTKLADTPNIGREWLQQRLSWRP